MFLLGYTAAHESWYTDNCVKLLFKLMTSPKSRHYQPELGKALKDAGGKNEENEDVNDKGAKPNKKKEGAKAKPKRKSRKSKGRGKGRGGANRKRKAEDDGEDAEDDAGSNDGSDLDEADAGEDAWIITCFTSCAHVE